MTLGEGGYLYLINGDGEIIYHPRQQLITWGVEKCRFSMLRLAAWNHWLPAGSAAVLREDRGTEDTVERFQGQSRQVTVKTVGYTGWKLVGVAPTSNVLGASPQLFLFGLSHRGSGG